MNDFAFLETFHQKNWSKATFQQRLDTLQKLENYYAQKQGRPACTIIAMKLDQYDLGGYYKGRIEINQDYISKDFLPYHCMDTVLHEGRHAYQEYAMRNPNVHSDQAEVARWLKNARFYKNPEKYPHIYRYQPLEQDANDYSYQETDQLYQSLTNKFGVDPCYKANLEFRKENDYDYLMASKKFYGENYLTKINQMFEPPVQQQSKQRDSQSRGSYVQKKLSASDLTLEEKIKHINQTENTKPNVDVNQMLDKYKSKQGLNQTTNSKKQKDSKGKELTSKEQTRPHGR